jgi:hypothetical protein
VDDSEEPETADDALINMLEEELESDLFTPIPAMPSNLMSLKESLVHDTGFYYLEREPSVEAATPAGGWLARYPEAAAAALAEVPAFAGYGKGLAKAAPVQSLRLTEGQSQIPFNSAAASSIRRVASEVAEGGVPYGGLPYGGLPYGGLPYGVEVYGDVFGGDPYQGMYIEGIPTPKGRGGRRKVQTRHKKKKSKKRARTTRRR